MISGRVLMIEDNEQNAYLARYLLEGAGLSVTVQRNGRDGIASALADKPDLILLDIQLPDLDGYAIARELKKDERTRHIPLVAVSSFAMPGEKAKAMELGCAAYIEKPIRALNFVGVINRFLKPPEDPQ